MPSLTPPAQNWVLRASEHAWELPGSGWGPWAERWLRTKVSFLAWQAAGSLLPKQHPPPRLAKGEMRRGSWTGLKLRLLCCSEEQPPFPSAGLSPGPYAGTRHMLGVGKAAASPQQLSSTTPFLTLQPHLPPASSPSSPSPHLGTPVPSPSSLGSSLAASVATGCICLALESLWRGSRLREDLALLERADQRGSGAGTREDRAKERAEAGQSGVRTGEKA